MIKSGEIGFLVVLKIKKDFKNLKGDIGDNYMSI